MYKISIRTKEVSDPTVDTLTLSLIGHLGTAQSLELKDSIFEKGSTNDFEVTALDVGPVTIFA